MTITILADNKASGKTTFLAKLIQNNNDYTGILSPLVKGKRFFYNIETSEIFAMEATSEEAFLSIGKYRFSEKAFDKAISALQNSMPDKILIIDEIGPLELLGKGFSTILQQIVEEKKYKKLILVIRNDLVNDVIDYFDLEKFSITLQNCTTFK